MCLSVIFTYYFNFSIASGRGTVQPFEIGKIFLVQVVNKWCAAAVLAVFKLTTTKQA